MTTEEPNQPAARTKRYAAWRALGLLFVLGGLVTLALIGFTVAVHWYCIPSGGMLPTLQPGDRIGVNAIAYRFHPPRRGDIIAFTAPRPASPDERIFVKRIVGLPGDTVAVLPTRILAEGHLVANLVASPFDLSLFSKSKPGAQGGLAIGHHGRAPIVEHGEIIVYPGDPAGPAPVHPVRILAVPQLAVRIRGTAVYNSGRRVAEFRGEQGVAEEQKLATYGGDPSLAGAVITVEDEPRLILVRTRSLSVDPGHLLLNGQPQREPYVREPPDYSMVAFTVPPGHYWVMGDNRNDSNDSHAWGPLRAGRISGRVDWHYHAPGSQPAGTNSPC